MKYAWVITLIFLVSCTKADESNKTLPPAGMAGSHTAPKGRQSQEILSGTVKEIKTTESITYVQLATKSGLLWVALVDSAVTKGSEIKVQSDVVQTNFHSKALNRKFDKLYFGHLAKQN